MKRPIFLPVLFLIACGSGQPGSPGPSGEDGKRGADAPAVSAPGARAPTINLVEPRVGLVARSVDVTITTDGTADLSSATISFGGGIKVAKTALEGNALVATLEIGADAPLGKHDIELDAGGVKLSAKAAFVVAVPLETKIAGGKAEPGGLVRLDLSNRDNIAFDPENFALLSLKAGKTPSLVGLKYESFTSTDGSVVLLGDPLATAGPLGFVGFNNPDDDQSASYLTAVDAVTVTPRTPETLASGSPVEKTFADDLQTGFFAAETVPAANEGLVIDALARVPEASTMKPVLFAYPKSGRASDLLGQAQKDAGFPDFGIPATEAHIAFPVTEASKAYFVVADAALAHGPTVRVSFEYSAARALVVPEKTDPHSTGETAQNVGSLPGATNSVPGRIVTGTLGTKDEADYYKFNGLSTSNVTDMLVSVIADGSVIVRVDTVPTFDSDGLLEIAQTGTTGVGITSGFVGKDRFIQVIAADGATTAGGKYTLGIKRIAQP